MERVFVLVLVFGTVVMCGEEVGAVTLPHAHPHRHQRLQHLQEAVDRLILRQRTDHILISNLQKEVMRAQQRDLWNPRPATVVEEEKRVLTRLTEKVDEVRGSVNLVLEEEHRRDDILELRQEVALLRSEVNRLKAQESERNTVHSHTQQQQKRDAVTAAWVVDNVQRLQEAVVDLQQAFNVTTAMHDKQEVEARLVVVSGDLKALRGSLAAVTSKAEAAAATVTALQEELTETSKDSHRSAGKIAVLEVEMSSLRDDFNNLLVALPEGIITEGQHSNAGIKVLKSRLAAGRKGQTARGTDAERQLETRMEAVEIGVGEVQASSMQLLATLEALETRMEKDVAEVQQEVAKLEYKATHDDNNT